MSEQITISKADAIRVVMNLMERRNRAQARNEHARDFMAIGFDQSAWTIAELLGLDYTELEALVAAKAAEESN